MPFADTIATAAIAALAFIALLGLAYRRRFRTCVVFPFFLLVSGLVGPLLLAWPDVFWTWRFMFVSSTVQALLSAGMAVEIAIKTLRPPLNAGRQRIRRLLFIIGGGTLLSLVFYPRPLRNAFDWTLFAEHTVYGTAWMFAAFLLVVRYYRVPLDPLHRDIAAAFPLVSFIVFYREALYRADPWFGLSPDAGRHLISKTVYALVMLLWAWSAWRRDDQDRYPPEVEKLLEPWRVPR